MKDLSANKREDLKYRCEVFRHELVTYRRKKEALQDIHNFILTTIARQHILYIANKDSVYQILSALKKRIAPTDRARELEVTRQYRDLQKAPKNQQIKKWIEQWEKIHADAENLDLLDIKNGRPLYDFLNAVRTISPGFADTKIGIINKRLAENKELPSLYNILKQYRNYI
jgi:hypothetical protein